MRITKLGRPILPVLCLTVLAACGGGGPAPGIAADSPGASLVVERYLQAVNQHDLRVMSELFGTAEGNMRELESVRYAEELAHIHSSLLRHDEFRILRQQVVPGRMHEAADVLVELRRGERQYVVPFRVVRRNRPAGSWIIEKIELDKVAGD